MNKVKKSVVGLAVIALVGGGAKVAIDKKKVVEPQKQSQADDKLIHVFGDGQKEIATVDMETKKVELKNGAECREVVVSAINYAKAISSYHEQFKRDVLNTKVLQEKQKEAKKQEEKK